MPKVLSASFPDRIAEIIQTIAEKKGTSTSDVLKDLAEDGLEQRNYLEDIDREVKREVNGGASDDGK